MTRCPFCAEEIQDAAIICRFCQRDLPVRPPPQPREIHGIALEDVSTPTESPAELQVPKGRTSTALLLIAGFVLFIATVSFITAPAPSAPSSSPSARQVAVAPTPAPPRLQLLSQEGSSSGGGSFMEVVGEVKNISAESLRNVQAIATWYDAQGGFITSDSALIEYDPILPGQTSPFKVMSRRNPAMERFRIDFSTLGGSLIDTTRPPK